MSVASTIAILGAGAVGSLVAARLAESGTHVTLIARGARLAQLRESGLTIRDARGERTVSGARFCDGADTNQPGILFLALKAYSLEAALPGIRALIGPHTMVVPLINGIPWWYFAPAADQTVTAVDPEGKLQASFASDRLIGAVVLVNSTIAADGAVVVTGPERLTIGRVDGAPCPRTQGLAERLTGAGLATRTSAEIREELWSKLALNLSSNPLSVVVDSPLSDHYNHALLLPTVRAILEETVALAVAHGVQPSLTVDAMVAIGQGTGAFRTSMAQDFALGRPLELASIGDAVLELAERRNVAMPTTRMIVGLARYQSSRPAVAA